MTPPSSLNESKRLKTAICISNKTVLFIIAFYILFSSFILASWIFHWELISTFFTSRITLISFMGISTLLSLTLLLIMFQTKNKKNEEKILQDKTLSNYLNELSQLKIAIDQTSIVAKTDLNGIITSVNDTFCKISKYSRKELIGNTHSMLNSNYHPKEFFLELWNTINQGEVWEGEIKNKAKDGTLYWVHTFIIPMKNKDGSVLEHLAIRQDITKRKTNEQSLIESEKQLKSLIFTRDKLLSVIAHDLRSPFNSITGFSNLIIKDKNKSNSDRRYAEFILKSSGDALELLDNLLIWAKSQTDEIKTHPKQTQIIPIINRVIEFYHLLASEKNISIQLENNENDFVYTDLNLTNTVLRNLLSNAVKFTENNGKIEISLHKTETHLEITVKDKGPGMCEEKVNKLFSHNHRGNHQLNAGLGLILCKEFAVKNGGDIWVDSKLNEGSAFTFSIPLSSEK